MSKEQLEYLNSIKRSKIFVKVIQCLIVISFFGIWELSSRFGFINSFVFSRPSEVFYTIYELIVSGELFRHLFTTLIEVFISFGLGMSLGLLIAIILYMIPVVNKILDPFLVMLNSLPKVAIGPMLIIWSGANMSTIIVMALLINLIVTIISILNGFNHTDSINLMLFKSLKASRFQTLRYLIIPSSYKVIISTIKLNISMTLIGVIMGEFLVSRQGIGYLIIYGTQVFNLNLVIAGVLILIIISFLLYKVITYFENKLSFK